MHWWGMDFLARLANFEAILVDEVAQAFSITWPLWVANVDGLRWKEVVEEGHDHIFWCIFHVIWFDTCWRNLCTCWYNWYYIICCIFYLIQNLCWRKKSCWGSDWFRSTLVGLLFFPSLFKIVCIHFWRVSRLSMVWNIKSFQTAWLLVTESRQSARHITVAMAPTPVSAQGNWVIHGCPGDFARGLGFPNWERVEKGSNWCYLEWHPQSIHICFI